MSLWALVLEIRYIACWIWYCHGSEWRAVFWVFSLVVKDVGKSERIRWVDAHVWKIIGQTHQTSLTLSHRRLHWLCDTTSLKSGYDIALLCDNPAILGNDSSQCLNAIMFVLKAHRYFTVAFRTSYWHVRAVIFQMLLQIATSLVHFLFCLT